MVIEILVIVVLIVMNGVFAMSEIAIVSAKRVKLEQAATKGSAGAKIAIQLAESPNHFLSTIQVGITLIGIVAGAYGGSTLAEEFVPALERVPWIGEYAGAVAFTITVGIITYLSLIVGELVPKRLALQHAESISITTAPMMYFLSRVASPIVWVLTFTSDIVLGALRLQKNDSAQVSDEEINYLVKIGEETGVFDQVEREMIRRVLHLDTLSVSAVMTPRSEIMWYNTEISAKENWQMISASNHAYFPVCQGELDVILGIAAVKDIWFEHTKTAATDLEQVQITDYLQPPIITTEQMPVLDMLEEFKASARSCALVVDEFGAVRGLITLKDILEAITGEIRTADEMEEDSVVNRADGSFLVDATMSIHDFKIHFSLPDEFFVEEESYTTIAGFILHHYKSIPKTGDSFTKNEWSFEIVDMDHHRIDKILVSKIAKQNTLE